MRTYASSFILSLTFATALVLPWAVSRRLRPVALSGSMSIAACQIPSALLYVEPPPPIAIVGLPSCEMRSQMRSHNGPPRGIHSYLCEDEGLDDLQQLDFGIVDIMYDWASGNSLAYVLHDRDMTGGDFVRNAKRLSDILQQISAAEPYLPQGSAHLAQVAHEAMELVNRGIVAYSGIGEG